MKQLDGKSDFPIQLFFTGCISILSVHCQPYFDVMKKMIGISSDHHELVSIFDQKLIN